MPVLHGKGGRNSTKGSSRLLFNSKVLKFLMKISINYKGFSGLQQQQIKKQSLDQKLAFISDNLGEYSTSWQASSFLNVNLFCCWFLVILTINIMIEISLTNIPINKCVHIPNAYFFLSFIIYLSHFKNQHALAGFRGRPPQNTKGPLSTLRRTFVK